MGEEVSGRAEEEVRRDLIVGRARGVRREGRKEV